MAIRGKGDCVNYCLLGECTEECTYWHVVITVPKERQHVVKKTMMQGLANLAAAKRPPHLDRAAWRVGWVAGVHHPTLTFPNHQCGQDCLGPVSHDDNILGSPSVRLRDQRPSV